MQLRKLFIVSCWLTTSLLPAQNSVRSTVHFDKNIHHLSQPMKELLREFVSSVDLKDIHSVQVIGHTDNDGTHLYNSTLSKKRSDVVSDYLKALGIEERLIRKGFHGERMPFLANTNEVNQRANRRVEILIRLMDFQDLEDFHASLQEMPRTEKDIDPNKNNTIEGKEGVLIKIPSSAFASKQGSVMNEQIHVVLDEALSNEQFVREGLNMKSGERLLETGGMIKISAFDEEGRPLELINGSSIQVEIPTSKAEPGMQTFLSTNGSDWTPDKKSFESQLIPLPNRPVVKYHSERLKSFNFSPDLSTKPPKPSLLSKPRAPKEPDPLRFQRDVKWHQVFKKKQIEERSNNAYYKAVVAYQRKLEKFERKKDLYEVEARTLSDRRSEYGKKLITWQEEQEKDSLEQLAEWQISNEEVIAQNRANYTKASTKLMAQWRAECDSIRALNLKTIKETEGSSRSATSYVLNTSSLGWINCDRFVEVKQKYYVRLDSPFKNEGNMILVFDDIRSMIRLHHTEFDKYEYFNLPQGEKARLVAYEIRNGSLFMSETPMSGPIDQIKKLRSSSMADFLEVIENSGERTSLN